MRPVRADIRDGWVRGSVDPARDAGHPSLGSEGFAGGAALEDPRGDRSSRGGDGDRGYDYGYDSAWWYGGLDAAGCDEPGVEVEAERYAEHGADYAEESLADDGKTWRGREAMRSANRTSRSRCSTPPVSSAFEVGDLDAFAFAEPLVGFAHRRRVPSDHASIIVEVFHRSAGGDEDGARPVADDSPCRRCRPVRRRSRGT
jgi:hypothetical protein